MTACYTRLIFPSSDGGFFRARKMPINKYVHSQLEVYEKEATNSWDLEIKMFLLNHLNDTRFNCFTNFHRGYEACKFWIQFVAMNMDRVL
jgi:hypothetical protein